MVKTNKGGCKIGRKDESPNGGCKVGKRNRTKEEKDVAKEEKKTRIQQKVKELGKAQIIKKREVGRKIAKRALPAPRPQANATMGQKLTGLTKEQMNKLSPAELFGMLPVALAKKVLTSGTKVGNMLPKKYEYAKKLPKHLYIVLHRHTAGARGRFEGTPSLDVTTTPSQHRPLKSADGKEINSKMLKEHIIELDKKLSLKNGRLVVEYISKDDKYSTKLTLSKAKALASGSIIVAPIDAYNDKFIRNVQVEDSKERMLKTINKYNP